MQNNVDNILNKYGLAPTFDETVEIIEVEPKTEVKIIYDEYKFNDKDLLTLSDFQKLVRTHDEETVVNIFLGKLRPYIIGYRKGKTTKYYTLDIDDVVYREIPADKNEDYFVTLIGKYVARSRKALMADADFRDFTEGLSKTERTAYESFTSTRYAKSMYAKMSINLVSKSHPFSDDSGQLHFKNGYLNFSKLNEGIKKRVIGKHYICDFIDRDYTVPSNESVIKMLDILTKLFPEQEELKCILFYLAASITGFASELQKSFFMIGTGSAGKSLIMEIMKKVLGDSYFLCMSKDSWMPTSGSQASDKNQASYLMHPNARIAWTNEPTDDKMDQQLFKEKTDGTFEVKILYQDGTQRVSFIGMNWITSNLLPKIGKIDSGVSRRMIVAETRAKFTEDDEEVDEKNYVYKKDRTLLRNFSNDDLNAMIFILLPFTKQVLYNRQEKIEYESPERFRVACDNIVHLNDNYAQFIEECLIVTGIKTDKVSTAEMVAAATEFFGREHNQLTLTSCLSDKGIKYNRFLRSQGIRQGGFEGVQLRAKETKIKYNLTDDDDKVLEEHRKEIEKLESIIEHKKKELDQVKADLRKCEKENFDLTKENNSFRAQNLNLQMQKDNNIEREMNSIVSMQHAIDYIIDGLKKRDAFCKRELNKIPRKKKNIIKSPLLSDDEDDKREIGDFLSSSAEEEELPIKQKPKPLGKPIKTIVTEIEISSDEEDEEYEDESDEE